jgi:hypothetical protein
MAGRNSGDGQRLSSFEGHWLIARPHKINAKAAKNAVARLLTAPKRKIIDQTGT